MRNFIFLFIAVFCANILPSNKQNNQPQQPALLQATFSSPRNILHSLFYTGIIAGTTFLVSRLSKNLSKKPAPSQEPSLEDNETACAIIKKNNDKLIDEIKKLRSDRDNLKKVLKRISPNIEDSLLTSPLYFDWQIDEFITNLVRNLHIDDHIDLATIKVIIHGPTGFSTAIVDIRQKFKDLVELHKKIKPKISENKRLSFSFEGNRIQSLIEDLTGLLADIKLGLESALENHPSIERTDYKDFASMEALRASCQSEFAKENQDIKAVLDKIFEIIGLWTNSLIAAAIAKDKEVMSFKEFSLRTDLKNLTLRNTEYLSAEEKAKLDEKIFEIKEKIKHLGGVI